MCITKRGGWGEVLGEGDYSNLKVYRPSTTQIILGPGFQGLAYTSLKPHAYARTDALHAPRL